MSRRKKRATDGRPSVGANVSVFSEDPRTDTLDPLASLVARALSSQAALAGADASNVHIPGPSYDCDSDYDYEDLLSPEERHSLEASEREEAAFDNVQAAENVSHTAPVVNASDIPVFEAGEKFCAGTTVEICGLSKAVSLNHQHGHIMSFNISTGRYEVQLCEDGSKRNVKPENIQRVEEFDFEGALNEEYSEGSEPEGEEIRVR